MAVKKLDIKKFSEQQQQQQKQQKQQQKNNNSNANKSLGNNQQKSSGGSIMDNPLFAMAKGALPMMPKKIKLAIGAAVYFIMAGLVATLYMIVHLIMMLF